MKVVNCVHCGTPNVVEEHGIVQARCIKCGEYVEMTPSILNLLPSKILWTFNIVMIILMIGLAVFLLIPR